MITPPELLDKLRAQLGRLEAGSAAAALAPAVEIGIQRILAGEIVESVAQQDLAVVSEGFHAEQVQPGK